MFSVLFCKGAASYSLEQVSKGQESTNDVLVFSDNLRCEHFEERHCWFFPINVNFLSSSSLP